MATYSSVASGGPIFGDVKDIFDSKLRDVRGPVAVFQEVADFKASDLIGNQYKEPVVLTHQGGVSIYASGTTPLPTSGAGRLNPPVSFQMQYAFVNGYNLSQPVWLPWETIAKAKNGDRAAYANETALILLSAKAVVDYQLELSIAFGQAGITQCSSISAAGTTVTFTVNPAYWNPGLFTFVDGHPYDISNSAGTLLTATQPANLTSVNYTTKVVTLSCNAADTAGINGGGAGCLLGRPNYQPSAANWNEPQGVMAALLATSGTVYGLTIGPSWQSNQLNVGGNITFGHLLSGAALVIPRGLRTGLNIFVSPANWADLMKDLANARFLDGSYSTTVLRNGAGKIEYTGSRGRLNIIEHPLMWNGFIPCMPDKMPRDGSLGEGVPADLDTFKLVGASKPTLQLGGRELSVNDLDNDATRLKVYANVVPFINALNQTLLFTGITPTT